MLWADIQHVAIRLTAALIFLIFTGGVLRNLVFWIGTCCRVLIDDYFKKKREFIEQLASDGGQVLERFRGTIN